MTYRKKLIEVALPLEAINKASAREKSIRHGHPSTLHLWWARRPLAAARAVIFTSLVDDPDDPEALPAFVEACKQLPIGANVKANGDTPRMRLFDFIEQLVKWESTTDEAILNTARELIQIATEGNPPPLLDPFAGGGSIPLEAQRLGLEAHASDLNPVAVMINKAQIEIPPRFANMPPINPVDSEQIGNDTWKGAAGLAADVRYYGEWMREKAFEKIGHLYPTHNGETVIAWLWARTVKCPNPACGAQMPLVSSFHLSKKKGKQAWVVPHIDKEAKTVRFEVQKGTGEVPEPPKVGRGAKFKCLVCNETAPAQHIKDEGMAGGMGAQLMAIVTQGSSGRSYYAPTDEHIQAATQANPEWFPTGELADDPRNIWCKQYGLIEYGDLFADRQLMALTTFSDLIHEAREQAHNDALTAGLPDDNIPLRDGGRGARAYMDAVSVYLAFAVDKSSDYWSSLCSWNIGRDNVRSTFGRQALPMVWDYAENNAFSESGGNWDSSIDWIVRVVENSPAISIGYAVQQDAAQLNLDAKTLSTDPPYYDNITYADLSDFFYVWMRRNLRDIYPDIFGTMLVPKEPELIASPYRHGGKEAANEHFESGMQQTFINIRRFIAEDYPLTVYYAFKQQDAEVMKGDDSQVTSTGWETMLTSLIESGFSIDGTWPIRTERGARSIAIGTNALASSIVLVCRPRPEDAPNTSRRAFVDALRRELPAALKEMQSGNIAPVDLAQASIGPGMAIYSRYSRVLEADGTAMSVRTALGLINQELDAYLAEQDGDIDADTRFAVDWFKQFGFDEGDFGQADVLARAKNTSVDGVENAGVIMAGKGKVRLTHWSEYDPGAWNPEDDKRATVWEATHHLIERLNHHGETGSAMLMQKMPSDMAAEARQLAYRLYSICERKSWADHARDYNALVISWSGIGEETARLRQAAADGDATEQPRLFDE
jgi:putative DNA methylase